MHSDNTADGLSVLAACTADVRQWYMQNGLQLNPDKSEAVIIGTAKQLQSTHVQSVNVAGVDLPVAELGDEGDGCRSGSAIHLRQARVGRGAIMQLPCTDDPSLTYATC